MSEAKLGSILRVNLNSALFSYTLDRRALQRARLLDGKLLLVSNVPDLDAATLVRRYKALADIERGFRVLKSEIEIAPVYHRQPNRIQAHAPICFLALVLYRVLRLRLKDHGSPHSPERALEIAGRIQHHQVSLQLRPWAASIRTLSPEQQELFAAVGLPPPTAAAL